MSGYLGSIGFSLPAAMGASAATQEEGTPFFGRQVVSVSGDGGFGQYMGEITTLVKYDMNITHVLLNNGELGKISKEQRAGEWDVWQTLLHNPSFAAFAELCGAKGIRVERPEDLDAALKEALAHEGGPGLGRGDHGRQAAVGAYVTLGPESPTMRRMSTSNLQGISVAERILSLQDAWDEIARSPDLVKVSEAQGAELDLRLDAHRQAPDDVQSWDEVKRELAR